MANQFLMIRRCFERQWRGLRPTERQYVREITEPSFVREAVIHQYPIWMVDSEEVSLTLMSIKIDGT